MQATIASSILMTVVLSSTHSLAGLEKQPASEYHARRVALAAKLGGGAALIFGANEPGMEYESWRQDEDFYYLSGWNEPGGVLLIEAALAPDPYREILFLPVLNPRFEKYKGEQLDPRNPEAARIAGFDEVRPVTELLAELVRILTPVTATSTSPRPTHLAIKPDDMNAKGALDLAGLAINSRLAPPHDLSAMIAEQRMTKSAGELALLKKAAEASVQAHKALFKAIEPGVSERTIEGLIDYKLKVNGCERPAYPSIIGTGANSTVLHYMGGDSIMKAGDLVVIDAAGEYSMYASDITRTLPVSGRFTARQREIYDIVLGAQQAAIASFVSGKSYMGDRTDRKDPNSLNKVAFDYINTHGKDLHNGPLGQYWIHGLGHSVGVDVHDPYDYSKPFGPGSVFALEPGVYIPEERIGVRIEDTFYVDSNGKLISLTGALPHTADEVEAAMKR
jgi:Xaa-Pro aminopeptidase